MQDDDWALYVGVVQRGADWSARLYSNRQLAWFCRGVGLTRRSSDAAAPRHRCSSGGYSDFIHADFTEEGPDTRDFIHADFTEDGRNFIHSGYIELRLGADRHLACRGLFSRMLDPAYDRHRRPRAPAVAPPGRGRPRLRGGRIR